MLPYYYCCIGEHCATRDRAIGGDEERRRASPLQRAMDTAACIAQACRVPLEPMPDLREIHCGDLEGEAISSVQRRLPVLWALNESESDDDFRWPGGESYRDLRQRVVASLEQARRACAGGTAAVVTHAGPVTQALNWVRHVPPRLWKANRPDNGSITELYFSDQGVRLGRFGVYPEDWQRSA